MPAIHETVPTYRFAGSFDGLTLAELIAIPGVYVHDRGRYAGQIVAPYHAGFLVERLLRQRAVAFSIEAAPTMADAVPWDRAAALLRERGELQDTLLEGFRNFQRGCLSMLGSRTAGLVSCAGGSGKTPMLIGALLLAVPPPKPLLVITKANARGQWAGEIRTFTHLEPYVLRPTPERKSAPSWWPPSTPWPPENLDQYVVRMQREGKRPIVVTAWTSLVAYRAELQRYGFYGLGMDEAHTAKSYRRTKKRQHDDGTSTRVEANNMASQAAMLSKLARVRFLTTATPIKDRVRDLYAILDYMEPGAWGTSSSFMFRYADAVPGRFGGLDTKGMSYPEELAQRLAFCRYMVPYDVSHAELAGMKRRESWVIEPEECTTAWPADKLRAAMAEAIRSGGSVLQVRIAAAAASLRAPLVKRIADEVEQTPNAKICIFDIQHANVDELVDDLRRDVPHVEVRGVYGAGGKHGTTPEKREQIRQWYMEHPGPCVLVATGESVGTGYNLHDTDIGFLAALPWTLGDLHQWEQRWFRIGQKRACRVVFCLPRGSANEAVANNILLPKLPAFEIVTQDMETAGAYSALAGTTDKAKIEAGILALLDEIDADALED